MIRVLLLLLMSSSAFASESAMKTLIWRNKPISITLVPGLEKAIVFNEDVQWSIPRKLLGIVSGEAASGTLLLKTRDALTQQRFHVRGIDSNTYYLLDITASASGNPQPVSIIDPPETASIEGESDIKRPKATSLIELTRFVFQWLYAPGRLIQQPPDVESVALKNTDALKHLVLGRDVLAQPIRQWRTRQGLYAIALELLNQEDRSLSLDARTMRSDPRWLSLAMHRAKLSAKHAHGDSTFVVVLAESYWQEARRWLR